MRTSEEILMHYGVARRSGRYPWGSGDNPYQHSGDFLSRVEELRKEGLTDSEIGKALGYTSTQIRAYSSIAKDERRSLDVARVKSLQSDGLNVSEIARKMGRNESSIRSLLNEDSEARMNKSQKTADFLKKQIDEKGVIDVGVGVERELNISKEKLNQALTILEADGYSVYGVGIPQITNPGKQTNTKVISRPDITQADVYSDFSKIKSIRDYYSPDGGETFKENIFHYPASLDSKRIKIQYAEEGGINKDGVIELRRGVDDISLGDSKYAQVRILVDGKHYLKGMAMYSDDLPDGVDVRFNTNKPIGTPKEKVFKTISDDPDNPFGSYIKANGQRYFKDADGKEHLSVINKVREEGDWDTWSKTLSSQMLSKQNMSLIKKQLSLTYSDKVAEFDEICSLTNPTVKRDLLYSFADDCDAAAVHLKAAALPRQRAQVILPVTTLKENEIYAPNYKNGETVALIRYPHGGTFEIPVLKVNNKHSKAKSILGNALDAVGINSKVADRLSGADFDGDTVVVIPLNSKIKIKSDKPLDGLKGFDPKTSYPYKEGMKVMKNTQTEMGKISNLITDMTLKGATSDELARAVRHSMVVIDAEKHKLNYKQSYEDNGIASLKKKYQGHINEEGRYSEGASTLISKASSEIQIPKRKGSPIIDPETGEKTYKLANETYIDPKTGKVKDRMEKSTKMAETKDAHALSSGTPQEEAYAAYANSLKQLANRARREMMATGKLEYSKDASELYKKEVTSLNAKLNIAEKNAPRERQAQVIANTTANAKKQSNPDMTKEDYKKIKQQALTSARISVGASGKDTRIVITDREWEAIQAGAISDSKLARILTKSDKDEIRRRATPRTSTTLSDAKINKIHSMKASGYTNAEIAEVLGVSTSTIIKHMN